MGNTPTQPDGPDEAEEFHLAIPSDRFDQLSRALSPDEGPNADQPERGVYCVITRSQGHDRVTYLVREVVMPDDGQVYYAGGLNDARSLETIPEDELDQIASDEGIGLQYDAEYRRRSRQAAKGVEGGGLLIAHTHPFGAAHPNYVDRRVAVENLYGPAQELPPTAPFAAMLYSESDSWHVRSVTMNVARTPNQQRSEEFGIHTATSTPATAIRVVGNEFEKLPTTATNPKMGPAGTDGVINPELVDSSRRIWGLDGQETLAGLRVGIVGCGGGGSILSEWLSRLGVGELVIVDYDRIEPANFNRHQGARPEDIEQRRLKVRASARVAEEAATAEEFAVRPVVGSIVESNREEFDPLPHLLDCDVIFNASDMDWGRKVLDNLAFAHLIPVLDGGSPIQTDTDGVLTDEAYSTISLTGPGNVCLQCADVWEPDEVTKDMQEARSRVYVDEDIEERAPSVISINGLVESLAVQRFQALVLGVAPELTTGALRYFPNRAQLRWRKGPDGELSECFASCDRPSLTGGGEEVFEDATYRFQDPNLTQDIEKGALQQGDAGVVELDESGQENLLNQMWGFVKDWVQRRRFTGLLILSLFGWYLLQRISAAMFGVSMVEPWFYFTPKPATGWFLAPISHNMLDISHLRSNLWTLLVAGAFAEPHLTKRKYLKVFLGISTLSIIIPAIANFALLSGNWLVAGPSGGIYGLWAFMAVYRISVIEPYWDADGFNNWDDLRLFGEAVFVLIGLALIVVVPVVDLFFSSNSANAITHLIGLLSGYVLGIRELVLP